MLKHYSGKLDSEKLDSEKLEVKILTLTTDLLLNYISGLRNTKVVLIIKAILPP
jgi:hypothetical protein